MIVQVFPLFAKGHILRYEMLEALSDYALLCNQLLYQGYADGILNGCVLTTTADTVTVNPGVLCFEEKLYLLKEPISIAYEATEETYVLKLHFSDELRTDNFVSRSIELFICEEKAFGKGDLELCRFKLQQGARLRYQYMDFDDRSTEYDTLNTIFSPFSAKGGSTLSPDITRAFAKEMLQTSQKSDLDTAFCIQLLSQAEPLNHEALAAYINHKRNIQLEKISNFEVYKQLSLILKDAKHGKDSLASEQQKSKWKIIVE